VITGNVFRKPFSDLGIMIPPDFTKEDLKRILTPYLEGKKGDKMREKVHVLLAIAETAQALKKEG